LLLQSADLALAQSQQQAVDQDVFPAGEFMMKAGAQLDEGGGAAKNMNLAAAGLVDAGNNLEDGAFAGAVAADNAQPGAMGNLKRDMLHGFKVVVSGPGGAAMQAGKSFAQGVRARMDDAETLHHVNELYGDAVHRGSHI